MTTLRKAMPFTLLCAALLVCLPLAAQNNPDCSFTRTFTGNDSTWTGVSNLSGNTPCVNWRVTFSTTATLTTAVTFQTSPDRVTWTSVPNTICSSTVQPPCLFQGANPTAAAAQGMIYLSLYGNYVRVITSGSAGAGIATVRGYGAKGASAAAFPQLAPGGVIAGLTPGTIPEATSPTSLGDSPITDNGTTIIVTGRNLAVGNAVIVPPSGGDDTTTIQTLLTAGKAVTLTPGAYTVSALSIPASVVLQGAGQTATTITMSSGAITLAGNRSGLRDITMVQQSGVEAIFVNNSSAVIDSPYLENLQVRLANSTFAAVRITSSGSGYTSNLRIFNLTCTGAPSVGASCILADSAGTVSMVGTMVYGLASKNIGLGMVIGKGDIHAYGVHISGAINSGSGIALHFTSGGGNSRINARLEGNDTQLIYDAGANYNEVVAEVDSGSTITDGGTNNRWDLNTDTPTNRLAAFKTFFVKPYIDTLFDQTGSGIIAPAMSFGSTLSRPLAPVDVAALIAPTLMSRNTTPVSGGTELDNVIIGQFQANQGATTARWAYIPTILSRGAASSSFGRKTGWEIHTTNFGDVLAMSLFSSGGAAIGNGTSTAPSDPGLANFASGGFISNGTKFTTSGAGCTVTGTTGGASVGSFSTSTTGVCITTITLNGATGLTAPNGWACWASDITSGIAGAQSGGSATTAVLKIVTTTGDTVAFGCLGY